MTKKTSLRLPIVSNMLNCARVMIFSPRCRDFLSFSILQSLSAVVILVAPVCDVLADEKTLESITGQTKSVAGLEFPVTNDRLIVGFPMEFERLQHAGGGGKQSQAANTEARALSKSLSGNLESIGILLDLKVREKALQELGNSYTERKPLASRVRNKLEKLLFSAAIRFLPEDTVSNYLASRSRGASVYETAITSIEWKGENEFQKFDTGAKFIAEILPDLLRKTPSLPLKFRMVKPVWVGGYRMDYQFVPFNDAIPPAAGSGLNLNHFPALVWKDHEFVDKRVALSPKQAEKLTQGLIHEVGGRKLAYIQAHLSLNPAPENPASYGLPHLISEEYYLSADVQGGEKLVDLDDASIALPISERQSIDTTMGEEGILLGADTELLLSLKNNPDIAISIDWKRAMEKQSDEARRHGIGYSPFVDRSHVASNVDVVFDDLVVARQVEAFKSWTLQRATKLPDKPIIIVDDSFSATGSGFQQRAKRGQGIISGDFGDSLERSGYNDGKRDDLAKEMGRRISNESSVMETNDLYRTKKIRAKCVTLVAGTHEIPESEDKSEDLKSMLPDLASGNRYTATRLLKTELETVNKHVDSRGNETYFIALKPIKLSAKFNDQIFYEQAITESNSVFEAIPAQAENDSGDTDNDYSIPDKPYGPELKGIRLGMNIQQAIDKIKNELGEVEEIISEVEPDEKTPFRRAHLITSTKTYETYLLISDPREGSDLIIAFGRGLLREADSVTFPAVVTAAEKKYGKATKTGDKYAHWHDESYWQDVIGSWNGWKYCNLEGEKISYSDISDIIKVGRDLVFPPKFNHYFAGGKKLNRVFYQGKKPSTLLHYDGSIHLGQGTSKKLGLPRQMEAVRQLVYDYKTAAHIYNEWYPKYLERQKSEETDVDF